MNTFDRHLLREWLQILGLVLAATCGLLLVRVLYEDFRDLRDLGARGSMLWRYLWITMPSFFAVVLPLALLVSLLYVLGKFQRANELTAMRARKLNGCSTRPADLDRGRALLRDLVVDQHDGCAVVR